MTAAITRRSTLVAAATVVVGGVIGFVYGRNSDAAKVGGRPYYDQSPVHPSRMRIAQLSAVREGSGVIASGVVVARVGGAVHAFSSTCTHFGCTVNRVAAGKIFCPCHGSVFSAQTGAVEQGPATQPLPSVRVTIEGGVIYTG
jgi:Rieske Fe-S protein